MSKIISEHDQDQAGFQRTHNNGAEQAAPMHRLACTFSLATKRDFLATNLTLYMFGNWIRRPSSVSTQSHLYELSKSYTMGCPPVRGDNPRALASGLSYVQVDKHGITILYHHHQCRPCTPRDISW